MTLRKEGREWKEREGKERERERGGGGREGKSNRLSKHRISWWNLFKIIKQTVPQYFNIRYG